MHADLVHILHVAECKYGSGVKHSATSCHCKQFQQQQLTSSFAIKATKQSAASTKAAWRTGKGRMAASRLGPPSGRPDRL